MRIINQTRSVTLAEDAALADTFPKRIQGLLGRKELKTGQALIIWPCNSIHTYFMRFPIDVLFVNKDNQVVSVIPSLKPYRLSPIYLKSCFVVELPSGSIKSTLTSPGDQLRLA